MPFSADTKIKDLLENPASLEVVESFFPGAAKMDWGMAKGMSLRTVAKFPQAKEIRENLEKLDEALKKLP
jgi:hypothetical protein